MTRSRVTTPPARRCIGDGSDEAIRVCALQSRCQVRSEPAWVCSHGFTDTVNVGLVNGSRTGSLGPEVPGTSS